MLVDGRVSKQTRRSHIYRMKCVVRFLRKRDDVNKIVRRITEAIKLVGDVFRKRSAYAQKLFEKKRKKYKIDVAKII